MCCLPCGKDGREERSGPFMNRCSISYKNDFLPIWFHSLKLWMPHPWQCPRPGWMGLWAQGCVDFKVPSKSNHPSILNFHTPKQEPTSGTHIPAPQTLMLQLCNGSPPTPRVLQYFCAPTLPLDLTPSHHKMPHFHRITE